MPVGHWEEAGNPWKDDKKAKRCQQIGSYRDDTGSGANINIVILLPCLGNLCSQPRKPGKQKNLLVPLKIWCKDRAVWCMGKGCRMPVRKAGHLLRKIIRYRTVIRSPILFYSELVFRGSHVYTTYFD
jgi:hypothetical protein